MYEKNKWNKYNVYLNMIIHIQYKYINNYLQ
jgi:hypothetical protein